MTKGQLVTLAAELAAIRANLKDLTAKESAIKAELNAFLDSKHVDSFGVVGATVTRSWQERVTLDTKKVSAFLGEQVKEYQTVTKFSVLKVGVA